MKLFDIIEGYREAVAAEQSARDGVFLGLPAWICGVPVREMTLSDFAILDAINSPFASGGEPSPDEVVRFLWFMSTGYDAGNAKARDQFIAETARLIYAEAVEAITEYLRETFQDAPGGGNSEQAQNASWLAYTVDTLASEYGWREADILALPLKRAFQYLKVIRQRRDPEAIMFNPSDRVKADWLTKQNQPAV